MNIHQMKHIIYSVYRKEKENLVNIVNRLGEGNYKLLKPIISSQIVLDLIGRKLCNEVIQTSNQIITGIE